MLVDWICSSLFRLVFLLIWSKYEFLDDCTQSLDWPFWGHKFDFERTRKSGFTTRMTLSFWVVYVSAAACDLELDHNCFTFCTFYAWCLNSNVFSLLLRPTCFNDDIYQLLVVKVEFEDEALPYLSGRELLSGSKWQSETMTNWFVCPFAAPHVPDKKSTVNMYIF